MRTGSVIFGNSSRGARRPGRAQRRDRRLHLVRGQRIVVQRRDRLRIAREVLVLQLQHRQPGGDVAQALDRREGKAGRRHLEGEALADEPGELGLVVEHVADGDDAAGAVAEQEHRQAGIARLRDLHGAGDVAHIVGDILDIEALAFRLAAAAQIERVNREAALHELLGRPDVLPAVRVDAVADDQRGAWLRSAAKSGGRSSDPRFLQTSLPVPSAPLMSPEARKVSTKWVTDRD